MQKIEEDERESLTARNRNDGIELSYSGLNETNQKKKKKKKKGKKSKGTKKDNKKINIEDEIIKEDKKKSTVNNEMFILNTYQIIKMLGFGTFGEIHLAYETSSKQLRAIKFETINQKNPQLQHEHNILEMLNKAEGGEIPEGIPKVFGFEKTDRYSYMMMEFLGPSLSDVFQFCNKKFSLKTVCTLGIQMLSRIEYMHEKGFIHRDIKPENFVIGLNENSNIVHIIDFGLSKRYKERNTGQHIAYRENRQLVGTVRYASINAHLGIEQSRRDDIESIGYVLVYFLLGRLPWQSKDDKNKLTTKIMEKKLMTPPEILCKKLPIEFSYYFHYCKNLKYEDRPDYTTLKFLFYNLLFPDEGQGLKNEFVFDWFDDTEENRKEDDTIFSNSAFNFKKISSSINSKRKLNNNQETNKPTPEPMTRTGRKGSDISSDENANRTNNQDDDEDERSGRMTGRNKEQDDLPSYRMNNAKKIIEVNTDNFNPHGFMHKSQQQDGSVSLNVKKENSQKWEEDNCDTDRDPPMNEDLIKNQIKSESSSIKNSDSQYKLLSSSDKSIENKIDSKLLVQDDDIKFKKKGNVKIEKNEKNNKDVIIKIDSNKMK